MDPNRKMKFPAAVRHLKGGATIRYEEAELSLDGKGDVIDLVTGEPYVFNIKAFEDATWRLS